MDRFSIGSVWEWEFIRKGKVFDMAVSYNKITNEGLNFALDVMFHGTGAKGTWYCALFEDDYTPLAGNTYAVPGYTESTAYGEAKRPTYVEAAASGQSITNSANKATFTINASKTIYGGSLVSFDTIGDTAQAAAVLFCSSKLATAKAVVNADVINLTITISVTSTT